MIQFFSNDFVMNQLNWCFEKYIASELHSKQILRALYMDWICSIHLNHFIMTLWTLLPNGKAWLGNFLEMPPENLQNISFKRTMKEKKRTQNLTETLISGGSSLPQKPTQVMSLLLATCRILSPPETVSTNYFNCKKGQIFSK